MASVLRSDSRVGEMVGNYRIKHIIAQGGMGCVFLAEHPEIGRRAALKVIHPRSAQDPALVMRFLNEARVCAKLHHPNVVDVFDLGTLPDGAPYVLMELLEGTTLAWVIKTRGRLPLGYAIDIIKQTALGLAAAHELNVVHRDVKPDNLFLIVDPRDKNRTLLKVLDFGVAKLMGGGVVDPRFKTEAGTMLGTPAYMCPEQFGKADEVDARADQYALGIILFEMVAGRLPFTGTTFGDFAIAHQNANVPGLAAFVPDVAGKLDPIIQRALAKQPGARFASLAHFVAALETCCADHVPMFAHLASTTVTLVSSPQHEATNPAAHWAASQASASAAPEATLSPAPRSAATTRSTARPLAWFGLALVVLVLAVAAFRAVDSGAAAKAAGVAPNPTQDPYAAEAPPRKDRSAKPAVASTDEAVAGKRQPQPEQAEHMPLRPEAQKTAASRGAREPTQVDAGKFKRRERTPQIRAQENAPSPVPPPTKPDDTYVPEPI